MTYELALLDAAPKEWRKLDSNTQDQFKKKLAERLVNPRAPAAKLSGSKDRYKKSRCEASDIGWFTRFATRN
jgi:mRNA interferase RelE/StbE